MSKWYPGVGRFTRCEVPGNPSPHDAHTHDRRKEKPVVTMTTCPMCGAEVLSNRRGRPRVYCSGACRRQMADMRDEIPAMRDQLAEAEVKAEGGFWPSSRFWHDEAHRLSLAIAERESRVVGVLP